ncbi:MAG: restriction endonuclease [Bacteroidales bacterium]|nr:restriction endonuclease [Bacteroidales bacterium]
MGNYWLHRISNEWGVAKSLLDKGYLTIGWQYLIAESRLCECITDKHGEGFESLMNELKVTWRSRWCLERFARFKQGDTVVVPLFDKSFAIVEVEASAKCIRDLPEEIVAGLTDISLNEAGLIDATNRNVDIGFFVKVKTPVKIIPRSYAVDKLQMRMKMRQTNASIDDLAKEVEDAAKREAPIDVHEVLVEESATTILTQIKKYVTADNFERVVKWYMEKIGASKVYIPPKNSSEKKDYADADVVAVFEYLGVTIYIQVKKHDDKTDSWAVEQITKYGEQQEKNFVEGMTYIYWVVSTADDFKDDAKEKANEKSVRLINGKEFSRMLAEVGVNGIDEGFNN